MCQTSTVVSFIARADYKFSPRLGATRQILNDVTLIQNTSLNLTFIPVFDMCVLSSAFTFASIKQTLKQFNSEIYPPTHQLVNVSITSLSRAPLVLIVGMT